MLPRASLLCITLCSSAVACGGSTDASGEREEVDCNYQEGEIPFDEGSVMGYSAKQRFGAYLGTHACSWTWRAPNEDVSLLSPGPGEVGAEVTLEYNGGAVTYAQDRRLGDVGGGLGPCRYLLLEAPMLLEIKTDDGTVSIRKDTTFQVYQGIENFTVLRLDHTELPQFEFAWADGSDAETLYLFAAVDTEYDAGFYTAHGLHGVLMQPSPRIDGQSDFVAAEWRCE